MKPVQFVGNGLKIGYPKSKCSRKSFPHENFHTLVFLHKAIPSATVLLTAFRGTHEAEQKARHSYEAAPRLQGHTAVNKCAYVSFDSERNNEVRQETCACLTKSLHYRHAPFLNDSNAVSEFYWFNGFKPKASKDSKDHLPTNSGPQVQGLANQSSIVVVVSRRVMQ